MKRFVLMLALACNADEPTPPVATPPTPVVEPAKREPPPSLGAELVGEVAKAKTRCKGAEGIDRATDLDAAITGDWIGEYRYEAAGRDPVVVEVTLTASAGNLTGRSTERNTFADPGVADLTADLVGDVLVGGRVVFIKTYTSGLGADHSILYIGQLDATGTKITGRWEVKTLSGTFTLDRAGLRG